MAVAKPRLAVLLPCLNEEQAIAATIDDYRDAFPGAEIVVCDNASTDRTAEIARARGARVVHEPRRGKGHAVRRLFAGVEADWYIIADGDNTYHARDAAKLLEAAQRDASDMVVGDRLTSGSYARSKRRRFHFFGNAAIAVFVSRLFKRHVDDPLSGLRVFSRRFVRTVPLVSHGFEIETELTLQAIDKGFALQEVPIDYFDRPARSTSKLHTFSDGGRILWMLCRFALYFKPLLVSLWLAAAAVAVAVVLGLSPLLEYFRYSYVYKVPSLVVAVGFAVVAIFAFFMGFVLESLRYSRMENFLLIANQFERETAGRRPSVDAAGWPRDTER